jgi:hypothetical protein
MSKKRYRSVRILCSNGEKYNKHPRELTEKEKVRQKRLTWIGIAFGTAFFIAGVGVYLSVK